MPSPVQRRYASMRKASRNSLNQFAHGRVKTTKTRKRSRLSLLADLFRGNYLRKRPYRRKSSPRYNLRSRSRKSSRKTSRRKTSRRKTSRRK